MSINTIIQVAIGLFFIWIILAMITSQIQEWIASMLSWRAGMLEDAIGTLLGNQELRERFYQHPLIKAFYTNHGKRKPGGIPDDKFALVVLEMLIESGKSGEEIKSAFESLKEGIQSLKGQEGFDRIASSLETLLIGIEGRADATVDSFTEARKRVEGWFNDSMDSLTNAYRRRVQIVAITVGILLASVLNVDSIAIATQLWSDPLIRAAVVEQAGQLDSTGQPSDQLMDPQDVTDIVNQLEELAIPIGWTKENFPVDGYGWFIKIGGLLITAAASAQGAPFWFDLMRKLLGRSPSSESED
ncbi:MAG TPA: hypothetical protein VK851_11510 [Anaerolineales bacterium]|nr:hypothetical protein [Anaerolineales bacterium]